MLLTHAFRLPPREGGRGACTLTLKTLVALNNDTAGRPMQATQATQRVVFGDDDAASSALLVRRRFVTALAVDGRILQLAETHAYDDVLEECLQAQQLLALRACFSARWPGGFLGLRRAAGVVLGAAAGEWLEPLATAMLTLRCAPARLSLDLLLSRSWQGEAHEAVGAYDAAATLYALNVAAIEELADVEEALAESGAAIVYHIHDKGIQPSVARWRLCEQLGFHALALKRGGRAALAQAAYERALAALPDIDDALERESMRIDILQKLITLRAESADDAAFDAMYRRLFCKQVPLLGAAETAAGAPAGHVPLLTQLNFGPRKEHRIGGPRSRRCFVARSVDDPARPCVRWRILEVPFLPESDNAQQPRVAQKKKAAEKEEEDPAQAPFNELAREHALPRVAGVCAACGAVGAQGGACALKACKACAQAFYCGAACQHRDWKKHRAACRAATAASHR